MHRQLLPFNGFVTANHCNMLLALYCSSYTHTVCGVLKLNTAPGRVSSSVVAFYTTKCFKSISIFKMILVGIHIWFNKDTCKKEAQGEQKTREEREMESCLSVCDLLSLARFGTKFTSFHDIAQDSALGLIPKPKHSGFRQMNEAAFIGRPQSPVSCSDTDWLMQTICRGSGRVRQLSVKSTIGPMCAFCRTKTSQEFRHPFSSKHQSTHTSVKCSKSSNLT